MLIPLPQLAVFLASMAPSTSLPVLPHATGLAYEASAQIPAETRREWTIPLRCAGGPGHMVC